MKIVRSRELTHFNKISAICPLLLLFVCFVLPQLPASGGSYICKYPSGTRIFQYDGGYLCEYPSGKRLYKWEVPYICSYPSGRRLFSFDGDYFCKYPSGERTYAWKPPYITDYPSGSRIFAFDEKYATRYPSRNRLLQFVGPVPVALVIAILTMESKGSDLNGVKIRRVWDDLSEENWPSDFFQKYCSIS